MIFENRQDVFVEIPLVFFFSSCFCPDFVPTYTKRKAQSAFYQQIAPL